MHRSKIIKKRTKHRETLLRNLRKGKARLEERATFQLIPYPTKFSKVPQMHRLYADLVLMEQNDTMISDISLCNNFKYYKNAQVVEGVSQKIVKYQVENKVHEYEDWRLMVENLQKSELDSMREWAELIKSYCERYEAVIKEFQQGFSIEKIHAFSEMNAKREKARQTILNTYPCMEIKSQLKDGQIQLTEVSYSEKYLAELGYNVDEYTSLVLKEGLPLNVPVDGQGASWITKMRLEKSLNTDPNGYQTSELESCVMMKNGFLKKVKCKVHYYSCFEKGVPGFVIIGAIVARQKPSMSVPKPIEGLKISPEFVDFMIKREREHAEFMWEYYDLHLEQKYANLHKVCKIRDLGVQANF